MICVCDVIASDLIIHTNGCALQSMQAHHKVLYVRRLLSYNVLKYVCDQVYSRLGEWCASGTRLCVATAASCPL